MKSVTGSKNLTILFVNLSALFFLIVFRSLIDTVLRAAGVSAPESYLDNSVYVLFGTSCLLGLRYISIHVPRFVQWMRPGFYAIVEKLDSQMVDIARTVKDMDDKVTKKIDIINTNLYHIDVKIDKIEKAKEAKAADIDRFRQIRRSKLNFLEKLSPELHKFAVIKTNSFVDFVMSIHATGFYSEKEDGTRIPNPRLNPSTIREDIICEALQVRQQGEAILGMEFMELFCMYHEKKVKEYIVYIENLLKAGDNYKHDRFQETSEIFMSDFLECLHHIYVDYIKGVRAEEQPACYNNLKETV